MRKIRFRGKSMKTGEWLYGYPVPCVDGTIALLPILKDIQLSYDDAVEDCDTLGAYTGCNDINGKEIYEGDIISIDYFGRYAIKYEAKYLAFCTKSLVHHDYNYGVWMVNADLWSCRDKRIKVIGNVFDNPELLGGVTDWRR